jgi:hypothetical protein
MGDSDECPSTVLHRVPRRGIFLLNLLYVSARGGSVCVYIRFKFLVIRSRALCFSDLYLCKGPIFLSQHITLVSASRCYMMILCGTAEC